MKNKNLQSDIDDLQHNRRVTLSQVISFVDQATQDELREVYLDVEKQAKKLSISTIYGDSGNIQLQLERFSDEITTQTSEFDNKCRAILAKLLPVQQKLDKLLTLYKYRRLEKSELDALHEQREQLLVQLQQKRLQQPSSSTLRPTKPTRLSIVTSRISQDTQQIRNLSPQRTRDYIADIDNEISRIQAERDAEKARQ